MILAFVAELPVLLVTTAASVSSAAVEATTAIVAQAPGADMKVDGKVAIITGGARGIGRAQAEAILAKGGKVGI